MELNLKILAPLLQCTSIYRCALFITAKNILIFYFAFTLPFDFLFFLHFILRVSLLTASPSLLSSSTDLLSITDLTSPAADPFLHCRSHKPNRYRPFSPLSISQAQPSTLFSIVDLTSCRPFSPSSISQAQPPQTLPFCFALIPFRSRRTKPRRWRRNWAISIS